MADAKYPPPLLQSVETEFLVSLICDWSIAHGLAIRPQSDPHSGVATTAPVTLFPSLFPRVCFEQGLLIQKAYNQLYAAISQDEAFLKDIVEQITEVDQFIAGLWRLHLDVQRQGYTQNISLGLFRSDYMVHNDLNTPDSTPVIKQIEFNTIASSFGGLSFLTTELHRYLMAVGYSSLANYNAISVSSLPGNDSTRSLALGLRAAFETYVSRGTTYRCCILFIVYAMERNIFDQWHLQCEVEMAKPMIPVFRLPFTAILSNTEIADTAQRQLLYHPPHNQSETYEVAVVYFRAGYSPQDYPDTSAWDARLQIERSNAIKCPSVLTQLAGAKKVQQVLATPSPSSPSILHRFADANSIADLEKTFANIFPLDASPAGLAARRIALDPELCKDYVLKPQREGGGNNIYRSSIPAFLRSLPESHWKSYILMEIITPPPLQNMILRDGVVEKGGVICELGIYGACMWNQQTKEILYNEPAGYLLRTKGDQVEEGGIAAGFGALDSCLLV